jgi:hypothetical protein
MLVTIFVFVPASSSGSGAAMPGVMLSAPVRCALAVVGAVTVVLAVAGAVIGAPTILVPASLMKFLFLFCRTAGTVVAAFGFSASVLGVTCHRFALCSLATSCLRGRALGAALEVVDQVNRQFEVIVEVGMDWIV